MRKIAVPNYDLPPEKAVSAIILPAGRKGTRNYPTYMYLRPRGRQGGIKVTRPPIEPTTT